MSYDTERNSRLKVLGMCRCDGRTKRIAGRASCQKCLDAARKRTAQYRSKFESGGMCLCGIPVEGNSKSCRMCKEYTSLRLNIIREAVIDVYGGKCNCCGELAMDFLCIDHIYNNGNTHRKEIKGGIYRWLRSNKYPPGFQVLCHNCNWAKNLYGICPHKDTEFKELLNGGI